MRHHKADPCPVDMYRCNGGVNTALQFDKKGALRFAALQSDAGKALLRRSNRSPDDISSIVLVEESGSFIKSEAILRIANYLDIPFPLLAQPAWVVPKFVRDGVYDQVGLPCADATDCVSGEIGRLVFVFLCHGLNVVSCHADCQFAVQRVWQDHSLQNEGC